jgi:hypothetical protein
MKSRWLLNVVAYTVAGALASAAVGTLLGLLGAALLPARAVGPGLLLALGVGILALARTLGASAIPFPQPARQTRDVWVKGGRPTIAAIRWGVDIGLVYRTRFTFPGTWFLTLVAVATQDPRFGATVLVAYWFGRAISVWIGPALMRDARETPDLLMAVQDMRSRFERAHAAALIAGVTVLTITLGARGEL